MGVRVFRVDRDFSKLPYASDCRAIIWPGIGAKYCSLQYFLLKPGESCSAHRHEKSEDIWYVVRGHGKVIDVDTGAEYLVEEGCAVFVEPGTIHQVKSLGPENYVDVGGPCPPDLDFYRRAGLLRG